MPERRTREAMLPAAYAGGTWLWAGQKRARKDVDVDGCGRGAERARRSGREGRFEALRGAGGWGRGPWGWRGEAPEATRRCGSADQALQGRRWREAVSRAVFYQFPLILKIVFLSPPPPPHSLAAKLPKGLAIPRHFVGALLQTGIAGYPHLHSPFPPPPVCPEARSLCWPYYYAQLQRARQRHGRGVVGAVVVQPSSRFISLALLFGSTLMHILHRETNFCVKLVKISSGMNSISTGSRCRYHFILGQSASSSARIANLQLLVFPAAPLLIARMPLNHPQKYCTV